MTRAENGAGSGEREVAGEGGREGAKGGGGGSGGGDLSPSPLPPPPRRGKEGWTRYV